MLALAVKEDVALAVVALGMYLWIARRERRLGLAVMGGAALWFAIGMFVVMPHFRGGEPSPFLSYYSYLGATPAEILRTLLTHPETAAKALLTPTNAGMLLSLLVPLGMLSLLEPGILLIAAPTLLVYGLSTNVFMQRMEQFQYAALVIPWVTLAAIYGLGRWYDRTRLGPLAPVAERLPTFGRLATLLPIVLLLAFSLTYQGMRGFTPLSRLFRWPAVTEHQRIGQELMKEIPPDAPLVAQDRLYPHLSQRQAISFLWPSKGSADYHLPRRLRPDPAQRRSRERVAAGPGGATGRLWAGGQPGRLPAAEAGRSSAGALRGVLSASRPSARYRSGGSA